MVQYLCCVWSLWVVAGFDQEVKPMSLKSESQITRGTRSVTLEYESPLLSSPARQLPHKIFVWDPNGKYLDCSFPNPVYGHFHGPEKLTGARITDLFSRAVSARLLKKITGAWKTGEEQFTMLTFERTGLRYQAAISCVPTQEGQIIGIVTDRILDGPLYPRCYQRTGIG